MKLPPHLSSKIDYLIPDKILQACELDRFDLEIILQGTACWGQYPQVRIWVDHVVIWQGAVGSQEHIKFSQKIDLVNKSTCVRIEMHSKDDVAGTRVDLSGQIVDNQSVEIKQLIVNDIDIVKNSSIFNFGHYQPKLSEQKAQYFQQHGYNLGPSHCLTMTENGEWCLNFDLPVVRSIAKLVAPQYTAMKWPDHDLLVKIIAQCNRVLALEQQIQSRKQSTQSK